MNKKRVLLTIVLVGILVILFTLIVNIYMICSTKGRIIDIDRLNKDYDTILVLGCKVEDDSPSLMLTRRLERAIDVYNVVKSKVILSGDSTRDDYDEVGVMNDYLSESISNNDLILDKEGVSTYDSLYRAKNVYKVKKLLIITQEYHMYRALYLANKLNIDAYGVVASDIPQKFIMLKNKVREIFARDKNFFKGIIKPNINYALVK